MSAPRAFLTAALGLVLVGTVIVSVVAIATSSGVDPSRPSVVHSSTALVVEDDGDADDLDSASTSPDGDYDD